MKTSLSCESSQWRTKRVAPHCEACFCKFAIVVSKKSASGLCAIKANSAFSIALKQVLVPAYAC